MFDAIENIQRMRGTIIAAAPHTAVPSCVTVTVQRDDGSKIDMVLLDDLSAGEELLAYATDHLGADRGLLWLDQAHCMDQIPFGIDPHTPILEMILEMPTQIVVPAA